jgi:hypothetical protein
MRKVSYCMKILHIHVCSEPLDMLFEFWFKSWCCLFNSSANMVGWRQRLDRDQDTRRGSHIAAFIVRLWAWGLMSPQMVQKVSQRVLRDVQHALEGADQAASVIADLQRLADLGGGGSYGGNMHRDLQRHLDDPLIDLFYLRMPLKRMKGATDAGIMRFKQCLLLPHVLFACLGNCYAAAWEKIMCPSRDRLEAFWDAMAVNPQLIGMTTGGWVHGNSIKKL